LISGTPTGKSSWRETPLSSTQCKTGQGSRGHEHQLFKALADSLINHTMRTNLKGFHPFIDEVMRAQFPKDGVSPIWRNTRGTQIPRHMLRPI